MAEMRALMREDDDTASTDTDPDAEDRATVTTVTIGDLDIVTQEATHAFGASGADQSGNVVWGAARVLAERIGGERFAGATVVRVAGVSYDKVTQDLHGEGARTRERAKRLRDDRKAVGVAPDKPKGEGRAHHAVAEGLLW